MLGMTPIASAAGFEVIVLNVGSESSDRILEGVSVKPRAFAIPCSDTAAPATIAPAPDVPLNVGAPPTPTPAYAWPKLFIVAAVVTISSPHAQQSVHTDCATPDSPTSYIAGDTIRSGRKRLSTKDGIDNE